MVLSGCLVTFGLLVSFSKWDTDLGLGDVRPFSLIN